MGRNLQRGPSDRNSNVLIITIIAVLSILVITVVLLLYKNFQLRSAASARTQAEADLILKDSEIERERARHTKQEEEQQKLIDDIQKQLDQVQEDTASILDQAQNVPDEPENDSSWQQEKMLELDIAQPVEGAWLQDEMIRYIKSKHGRGIYLLKSPETYGKHLDMAFDGEEVKVIAKQQGYTLVCLADQRIGWCSQGFLRETPVK